MMLYTSKLISVLPTPLGVSGILLILGLALTGAGRLRAGRRLMATGLLILWVASMPVTSRLALGMFERQYPVLSASATQQADVAIILGGALVPAVPPQTQARLGDAADRLVFGWELYRAGKIRRILVSGGNLPWNASAVARPEAEEIRSLLIAWGVPPEAIIAEGGSRTTAENARNTAALWPSLGASSALLVTSAFHMPRALATFRKAGLPVAPAPTDVRAADQPLDVLDFLPDAESLKGTSDAAKEAVGYAVYWLRGDL